MQISGETGQALNNKDTNDLNRSRKTSLSVFSLTEKCFNLAWNELIDTERNYVNFLQHVYDVSLNERKGFV